MSGDSAGFFLGVPGQLYRIDLLRTLKGTSRRGFYFVFLPIGTVRLGSRTICKTDPQFPVEPTLGKRVLIFTSSLGGAERELVEIYEPEDIVIERVDGTAAVAPRLALKQSTVTSSPFADTVSYIEKHLAAGENGKP